MEVIRPGVIPEPRPAPWPVGFQFTCPNCSCLFRIEAGDKFDQITERCINGNSWVTVACPTCHESPKFDRKSSERTPISGMNK